VAVYDERQSLDFQIKGQSSMQYISHYESPLGAITLAADEKGLIGLWFDGEKYFGNTLEAEYEEKESVILKKAEKWLDTYFMGRCPEKKLPLHLRGTEFQKTVWAILLNIPYGQTETYGKIAEEIARNRGREHMSAQAVGGAVGHNPVSIIVPCHRVVGTDGNLTGYAGGIERKIALLQLEGHSMESFYLP
jgi:methylated-DNA-[protein]-cysteine S-methyltransferase